MTTQELDEIFAKIKASATKLEGLWIERERSQRTVIGNPAVKLTRGNEASEATKKCRLELQKEFGLTK